MAFINDFQGIFFITSCFNTNFCDFANKGAVISKKKTYKTFEISEIFAKKP